MFFMKNHKRMSNKMKYANSLIFIILEVSFL